MKRRPPAQIELVSDDHAITRTPYDLLWIENLKHLVPTDAREYDPDSKEWAIYGRNHIDAVIALTKRLFPQVEVIDSRRPSSPERRVATLDQDFAQLYLLPIAPASVVRASYRALSQECHPDKGGSHSQMVALNASYDRLREAGAA